MALFAPEGSDPDQLGRKHWKKSLAWAAAPWVGGQAAPYPTGFADSSDRFKSLSGQPWVCAAEGETCVAQWLTHKEALAAQREQGCVWGLRCERLLDAAFEFEEPLPPRLDVRSTALVSLSGLVACERWFTTEAELQRNAMTDLAVEEQGQGLDWVLGQARHQDDVISEDSSWWTRLTHAAAHTVSLQRLSFQVERTKQATNQLWLGATRPGK